MPAAPLTNPPPPRAAPEADSVATTRKADHIQLAFASKTGHGAMDPRFYYEPALAAHPTPDALPATDFGGYALRAPLWVSSMTGGTEQARRINTNLARACREFGMGMGLGSCRALLHDTTRLPDFDMRPHIGPDAPLFANLGVAQVEHLLADGEGHRMAALLELLRADGLIVHVNPLQEWLQPEGDRYEAAPVDTIAAALDVLDAPVIVKEVGQGFGPKSVERLLAMPLLALEFAAAGGTNFARLENLRADETAAATYQNLEHVGHTAAEMVGFVNAAAARLGDRRRCKSVILSGGVRDFLDGYYLRSRCALPSLYGQASPFLRHATGAYEDLRRFVGDQLRGLALAHAYLTVREDAGDGSQTTPLV